MPNTSIVGELANKMAYIIRNINLILEYYVPGFCLVFVYRRFRSSNFSGLSETIQFGICIVLSYLLHMLWMTGPISLIMSEIGTLYFAINKARPERECDRKRDLVYRRLYKIIFCLGAPILFILSYKNDYFRVVYEITLAIILAIDLVLLHENQLVKYAFSWVNNTTLSETVFECSKMVLPCDVIVYGEREK